MASTGEVATFGEDKYEAILSSMRATNFKAPKKAKGLPSSPSSENAASLQTRTRTQLIRRTLLLVIRWDRADMLPDHGFIGCEPFLNGVVQALGHIRDGALGNVRLPLESLRQPAGLLGDLLPSRRSSLSLKLWLSTFCENQGASVLIQWS